jgi:beta-aspartyl-peptidase (threonine type)
VSATGLGETFIRAAAAAELCARVRIGHQSLQEALDAVLADVQALGGNGGLIAVGPAGEAAWGFTTAGMYRGVASPDGREVRIYAEGSAR